MTDEAPPEPLKPHDENLDNPVGRLWRFLEYTWGQNSEARVGTIWANYVNLPADDSVRLFAAWARLVELPDQAQTAIETAGFSDRKVRGYLEPLPRARQVVALVTNSNTPASSAMAAYSAADLKVFEICSGDLIDLKRYASPTSEGLANLKALAQELIEEITRASVTSDFMLFLIGMMRRVIDAIDSYAVGGSAPLEVEVERFAGRVHMTPNWKDQLKRVPAVAMKFGAVILALTQLMTTAQHEFDHDVRSIETIVTEVTNLVASFPKSAKAIETPKLSDSTTTPKATHEDDSK